MSQTKKRKILGVTKRSSELPWFYLMLEGILPVQASDYQLVLHPEGDSSGELVARVKKDSSRRNTERVDIWGDEAQLGELLEKLDLSLR